MNSARASLMTFPDMVTLTAELGGLADGYVRDFRANVAPEIAEEGEDLRPQNWVQWVFMMGWSYGSMLEKEFGDYCRCEGTCCE